MVDNHRSGIPIPSYSDIRLTKQLSDALALLPGVYMTAIRCEPNSTSANLNTIIKMLLDPKTERVILFATDTKPSGSFSRNDGPENNLPLVAAIAEFKIPGISSLYVVFDGLFLTAARQPRYLEVRELLDNAINSGNAFFSKTRAPFTSGLSPENAAQQLLQITPVIPLTSTNRADYFGLLSSLPEKTFE